MTSQWMFGLLAVVCFGLAGVVPDAQGADAEHFLAVGLVRFAADFDLPDISLPDVHGKDVQSQSFRGQVVLLNFWTTW